MKRIIASASLAALGAASLHAAYAPGASENETAKPWSVSASLRGFYDDNYALRPSGPAKRDSFGLQVSPTASLNLPFERTFVRASYTYDLRWYEDREGADADHAHFGTLSIDHAASDIFKMKVADTFSVFQEPQLGDPVTDPFILRSRGDNFRNNGALTFNVELSPTVSLETEYANRLYDYDQHGPGSYSALLDRIEHAPRLDFRWTALPTTVGVVGYQFGLVDHTSSDSVWPGVYADPDWRNTRSHTIYVGADHTFTSQLRGSVRVGGRYTEYPDALPGMDDSTWSPYANANVTYAYMTGSYAQLGVRHDRFQSDLMVPLTDTTLLNTTIDQELTSVYGVINHKITGALTANVMGQAQFGNFKGGLADDKSENLYLVGINLAYQFTQNLAGEVGYNYDTIDSDYSGRTFDRNRVYLGVRASY